MSTQEGSWRCVHVIEFGSHIGVASNVAYMLKEIAPVSLHTRYRFGSDGESAAGQFGGNPNIWAAQEHPYLASILFYVGILTKVRRRDLIWLSTGPEHAVLPDVVFLGVLIALFRRGLVLSIRDANNWMAGYSNRGLSALALRLRRLFLRFVPRLVFETRQQEVLFFSHYPRLRTKSATCPTMFSDGWKVWLNSRPTDTRRNPNQESGVQVGLVGAVDPDRRNFSELIRALEIR